MVSNLVINNKIIKHPIIQGGMGIGISLSRLASAAIKNGCVGTISAAQPGFKTKTNIKDNFDVNIKALKEEISKVRKDLPDGTLGVNVMYAGEGYDEYIKVLAKEDIDFIVSGAGLPLDMPKGLVDSNVKPAVIVSSARAAKIICKRWKKNYNVLPEFIVVEGPKAGGHLGFTKDDLNKNNYQELDDIVKETVEVVRDFEEKYNASIPVIAAGGIDTKEEIDYLLSLGAKGVQIATKFICTDECDTSDEYKNKLVNATKDDVVYVTSPVGLPGRAIRNNFTEQLLKENYKVKKCVNCLRACKKVDIPYCINEKLSNASKGEAEEGLVFTGANGYKLDKIVPFSEVVKELTEK